jgi:hypothetical protein
MQRPKKAKRDTSTYYDNITASLRIIRKTNPDNSAYAYEVASAVGTYAKDSIVTLWQKIRATEPVAPPPAAAPLFDSEAEPALLNRALENLEDQIKTLLAEKKLLDETIAQLKNDEKEVNASLSDRQLAILAEVDKLLLQKIKMLEENIREHAARRVDLFFLLAIAVYKKNVYITKGPTVRQHGIGSKKKTGTAGCHASLFPNPVCQIIPSPPANMVSNYLTWTLSFFKKSEVKAVALIAAPPAEPLPLLAGTYLEDVLNMTTELPVLVNDFDGHMEGKFQASSAVKACLAILNRVSTGAIDPVQALTEYCRIMILFFNHMEYNYGTKEPKYFNHGSVLAPVAFREVMRCEKEGTFRVFDTANVKPLWAYVKMMLGLKNLPLAKRVVSDTIYSGYVEERILAIQNEMLATESEFAKKLKK